MQALQDRFVGCRAFDRGIVRWIKRSSAADAGGDRFLGGDCFWPTRWGAGLDVFAALIALICSASSETLGPSSFPGFMGRAGKAGLELVTQGGQFGQVGIVRERLAEPCLVVAKLGFGDGEVLPDAVAFGAVAIGQSFQGVQDGPRPLVVAR